LLADKAVELGFSEAHLACTCAYHSDTCPGGRCQGKNELKPHLKQTWCIGKLDSRFLARMETLLALYRLPYDPDYPVICYDERPCFLIGETVAPVAMQRGRVRKEHYAYEELGSCALLAMIEPLTGQRLAQSSSTAYQERVNAFLSDSSNDVSERHQNQDGSR
jgi:hypothetical protein